jgi:sialic acid synthase SpsE
MNEIKIGGRILADGHPVCIVFEAGPTHDGVDSACKLIDVAAAAGADAIKFQIVDADKLVPDRTLQFQYQRLKDAASDELESVSESLWEILKRRELRFEEWDVVIDHCRNRNLAFFSTVTSLEELEYLAAKNVDCVKICSGDITYHNLLRQAAKRDWAVQIDTGGATLAEVEQAVEVLEGSGCKKIIINHCPSGYPARLESINLRVLGTLRHMYPGYAVAFSDHTPGRDMDVAAVALGAHMLEKTITLDRATRSPEHVMSLEPHEAKGFIKAIREVEIGMGGPRRLMGKEERASREVARRSMYAAGDLPKGHVLTEEDIVFARPGGGLPANMAAMVVGRTLSQVVGKGKMLGLGDIV